MTARIHLSRRQLDRLNQPELPRRKRQPAGLVEPYEKHEEWGYLLVMPFRTKNPNNKREHWRTVSVRTKAEREYAAVMVAAWALPWNQGDSYRITLTRIGPRPCDVGSLGAILKGVQDGVADGLGFTDDADARLEWIYRQERRGNVYGVIVEIERR